MAGRELEIRAATPADVAPFAAELRDADRAELEASHGDPAAAIEQSLAVSGDTGRIAFVGGRRAAMFGLQPLSLLPAVAAPWLLTTPAVERVPVTFARVLRAVSRDWARTWTLRTLVDSRYHSALRLLSLTGYHVAGTPAVELGGVPFVQVEWRVG